MVLSDMSTQHNPDFAVPNQQTRTRVTGGMTIAPGDTTHLLIEAIRPQFIGSSLLPEQLEEAHKVWEKTTCGW